MITRDLFSESAYVSVTTGNTATLSHTTSGYYRGLLVDVYEENGTIPTTVTYNGIPMVFIQSTTRCSQWYLYEPASGANNIVVTASANSGFIITATSYNGVLQSASMINTFSIASSVGEFVDVSLTTTVANCWVNSISTETSDETILSSTYFTLLGTDVSDAAGLVARTRTADSNGVVSTGTFNVRANTNDTNGTIYIASVAIAPATLVPVLDTSAVDSIGLTTARANGESIWDANATITQRGFCYATTASPDINDSKVITTGTIGTYSADITGLTPNTTYYVRAYATNATGTGYGDEVSFTTDNIGQYELQKEIDAEEGQTILGRINVTGTTGTITVQLGTTGTSTVINAGAGNALFSGTYSGVSGLIITRSASFDGTIDNVYYVSAPLDSTVDWDLDTLTIVTAIDSSVFFKRIEDQVFNSFTFYRYLDLLFKDLDGYVTVTIRDEREDVTSERTKVFSVGNTESGTVSPFQKKRISFLIKNQAVIIGLSNANVNETFSIAQFLLTGHKKPEKMFSPSKIISLS